MIRKRRTDLQTHSCTSVSRMAIRGLNDSTRFMISQDNRVHHGNRFQRQLSASDCVTSRHGGYCRDGPMDAAVFHPILSGVVLASRGNPSHDARRPLRDGRGDEGNRAIHPERTAAVYWSQLRLAQRPWSGMAEPRHIRPDKRNGGASLGFHSFATRTRSARLGKRKGSACAINAFHMAVFGGRPWRGEARLFVPWAGRCVSLLWRDRAGLLAEPWRPRRMRL